MKTSSAQLKQRARRVLSGRYGVAAGAQIALCAIPMGVTAAMEILFMIGSVIVMALGAHMSQIVYSAVLILTVYVVDLFLDLMLMMGFFRLCMKLCKRQNAQVGDIFFAFKNHPGKFIGITLVLGLFAAAVMTPYMVLIVASAYTGDYRFAGVFLFVYLVLIMGLYLYVGLTYGMFYYILAEDPEKGVFEALAESRRLMTGNRGRYFCLGLSFIGWILLACLTFGIGFLWLMPYMICTNIQFYLDLKPQAEPAGWQI